jgi:hypothetical protein
LGFKTFPKGIFKRQWFRGNFFMDDRHWSSSSWRRLNQIKNYGSLRVIKLKLPLKWHGVGN